jgi:2-dehydro-3-deoxyphosphogluconate aldolase/(4S)-4-hydroxy-2-oxoglutarate aldolase
MTVLDTANVLAIVRFREPGDLIGTLDALAGAGVLLVEVTLDTPRALEAVERAARDGRTIGVGTVVNGEQVRASAAAGARFVVGPGLVQEVVEAAADLGLEAIPGVLSPTEILQAKTFGAEAVKLFPASLGGPDYVRVLRGPFPTVGLLPTGGIDIGDVPAYLAAGATCVGLGSALVGAIPPASQADLDAIASRAALAFEAAAAPDRST